MVKSYNGMRSLLEYIHPSHGLICSEAWTQQHVNIADTSYGLYEPLPAHATGCSNRPERVLSSSLSGLFGTGLPHSR